MVFLWPRSAGSAKQEFLERRYQMMKKILALLMASVLVLALAACGGTAEPAETEEAEATETAETEEAA